MLKSIKKNIISRFPGLNAEYRARKRIAKGISTRRSTDHAQGDVIILPASHPGSLGDSAMLEGLKKLLLNKEQNLPKILDYKPEDSWADELQLSSAGTLPKWKKEYLAIADVIQASPQVYVNGADVLDGKYSIEKSLERLQWIRFVAEAGCPVTVTGFSFRSDPPKQIVAAFSRLPSPVRLCPRDSVSYSRIAQIASCQIVQVADLAFQMDSRLHYEYERKMQSVLCGEAKRGRRLVGICLNLHTAQMPGRCENDRANWLIESTATALEELMKSRPELLPVLIPHDYRSNWNDVALSKALASHCGWQSADYVIIDERISAPAIKAICAQLTVLVSGRMHCGIAALGQGVPTALFDYQGKVEGLLGLFGLESSIGFCADPKKQAKVIIDRVLPLLQSRDSLNRQICSRLPAVLALAAKNVV